MCAVELQAIKASFYGPFCSRLERINNRIEPFFCNPRYGVFCRYRHVIWDKNLYGLVAGHCKAALPKLYTGLSACGMDSVV